MDFFSLLSVMARRWLVVVPVLLLTLVAGLVLVGNQEERYVSDGSELLRVRSEADPSSLTSQEIEPSIAATVLANALGQPAAVRTLSDVELGGSFSASVDQSGSIVILTVTSDSAEDAAQTANTLLELAPSLLENLLGADAIASVSVTQLGEPIADDAIEIEDEFVVTAYMSVLAPAEITNPFPAQNSTAQLLVEVSRRTELADAVREVVPDGEFQVQLGGAVATPIVVIGATASEPTDVVAVYNVVVSELGAELLRLQEGAGVPAPDQTVLYPLVEPTLVEQTSSSVMRAAAGVALLGLAAAAVLAIIVDARLRRRQDLPSPQWGDPAPSEDLDPSEEDQNRAEMVANS